MTAKLKVLVVEHEVPVAMQMVAALTQAGCNVKAVCTGKKGMEQATMKKFDLIVLDAHLPDANSFEICNDLKQRHISKNTPLVFISGKSSQNDRQHSFDVGAADYISKPIKAFDFVSRLLSHIKTEGVLC